MTRGAQAAVVVFDLTNYVQNYYCSKKLIIFQSSFIKAQDWVRELQRKGHPNVVIAIAGNKSDMAHMREVTTQVWYLFHTINLEF